MINIKQLLEKNKPFAVMQYFQSFKGVSGQTFKKYELIYATQKKEIDFKLLNFDEISFLKENIDKIKLIINNKEGRIWEFNNFKQYTKTNFIKP
jgi:hypothetical protein